MIDLLFSRVSIIIVDCIIVLCLLAILSKSPEILNLSLHYTVMVSSRLPNTLLGVIIKKNQGFPGTLFGLSQANPVLGLN